MELLSAFMAGYLTAYTTLALLVGIASRILRRYRVHTRHR